MVSIEVKQARSALIQRRKQLQDELRGVEQAIQALESVIAGSGGLTRPRRGRGVKQAVVAIMRDAGEIHADEVLRELRARGVELSSQDPKATVVTALIRLRDSGQVAAMGKNRFRWISSDVDQDVL